MNICKIDSSQIKSWASFHELFAKQFKFPIYYGRNMDAWIDCMEDCIEETTVLDFGNCRQLKQTHPEIIEAINESVSFINYRKLEIGVEPLLLIAMLI